MRVSQGLTKHWERVWRALHSMYTYTLNQKDMVIKKLKEKISKNLERLLLLGKGHLR